MKLRPLHDNVLVKRTEEEETSSPIHHADVELRL